MSSASLTSAAVCNSIFTENVDDKSTIKTIENSNMLSEDTRYITYNITLATIHTHTTNINPDSLLLISINIFF